MNLRRLSNIAASARARRLAAALRNDDGATAVEFALIALPFFGLMFAIIQTSVVMFASQALQTATARAARTIMTGESKAGATGLANFRSKLCGEGASIFNCDDIKVQVMSWGSFDQANPSSVNDDNCLTQVPPPASCWAPGAARSIVVVKVSYDWPFAVNLEDLDHKTRLNAVAAFRNEPF